LKEEKKMTDTIKETETTIEDEQSLSEMNAENGKILENYSDSLNKLFESKGLDTDNIKTLFTNKELFEYEHEMESQDPAKKILIRLLEKKIERIDKNYSKRKQSNHIIKRLIRIINKHEFSMKDLLFYFDEKINSFSNYVQLKSDVKNRTNLLVRVLRRQEGLPHHEVTYEDKHGILTNSLDTLDSDMQDLLEVADTLDIESETELH